MASVTTSEPQGLDRNGLEVLSVPTCIQLLRSVGIGRIAITDRALPVILPVNFILIDDMVVFTTGLGTKLATATARSIVAFEADQIDPVTSHGWSVCVTGTARRIIDPDLLARIELAGLEPAVRSAMQVQVGISLDMVSGRRVS